MRRALSTFNIGCMAVALLAALTLTSCGEEGGAKVAITIESSSFKSGEVIPKKHTGEGADVSPALKWSGVPAGTKELALICDDPDAPVKEPWVHWVIFNIPAATTGLPEGVAREKETKELAGAKQGKNDFPKDNIGYRGPMPPPGHGVHHYHFKLYALDAAVTLDAGATKDELLAAMKGHILAQGELLGTYERKK